MASDEQRSPWFAVKPERQASEDVATPADAIEPELPDPAPPRVEPSPLPTFDDLVSPPSEAARDTVHFEPTPSRPTPSRATAAHNASSMTPSATPLAPASEPEPEPEPESELAPPVDAAPSAPAPSEQVAPAPLRSPYLSAERPRPQPSAHEAPAPATSAQESWGLDRRATPPITEALPQVVPAPLHEDAEPLERLVPYAPWTGAIPLVTPPVPTPAPESSPARVAAPDAAPADFSPAPDAAPADFSPAPDAAPADFSPALVNGLVPTPIEAEEADIIAPVQPPSAAEIQPQSSDAEGSYASSQADDTDSSFAGTTTPQEFTPDIPDPVKELGASALSTASLEAAGAPTPRAGIPLVGGLRNQMPSFGDDAPFVPRFEPQGGLVPAPVPTVSFTTPHAAARPLSPLSDLAVPESDEPAYVPKVELGANDLSHMSKEGPDSGEVPSHEDSTSPSRPWATVSPDEVEFVTGEPLGPETGAFEAETASPSSLGATGSVPANADGADTDGATADGADAERAATHAPGTTAAAFFAATAARSSRASADAPESGPIATPLSLPADTPPADEPPAQPFRRDATRTEPFRTTATAYTPSQGEWSPSTISTSEAAALDDDAVNVGDPVEETAPPSITDDDASVEPVSPNAHGRRRLVLWIVLAAFVAAAIGAIAYRLFFVPEPETLPVPTVTAAAPTPTAEPVSIADPSDFLVSMPSTVGTNVLLAYEVTDPAGDGTLPARAAEHVRLDYGPGSESTAFTVDAFQHYSIADAQTAYDSYAADVTDVEDVVIDGTTVGQRAFSTAGATGTIVWRNETAVFVLTGTAAELLDFYAHFGV